MTTHEAEASASSDSSPKTESNQITSVAGSKPTIADSNAVQTSQNPSNLFSSINISSKDEKTGETEVKSQDSNNGVEATSTRTEAREQLSVGGTAEEEEALKNGDDTGATKGVETVQITGAATANGLNPQETPTDDTPSKVDADGVGSAIATTDPMGLATEPQAPSHLSEDSSSIQPFDTDTESVGDPDDPKGALHDAVVDGSAEDIKKLLKDGADILAITNYGETALHRAVRYNNIQAVTALLEEYKEKKHNINCQDDDGWTPLYSAVTTASVSGPVTFVSKILEIPGVDLTVDDRKGRTPLYRACYFGNVDVAKLILETKDGAKTIETRDNQGWTPLQVACSEGELKIVDLLLSPGYDAKTDVRDHKGRTPLHSASSGGTAALIRKLLSKQQTLIDQVDLDSQTALHLAVQRLAADSDAFGVLEVLIEKGAKIEAVDSDGRTALQLAGRGEGEVYKEAIKIISRALDPGKRKESLLGSSANEEPAVRDRLLESLDWTKFTDSEVKGIKEEVALIGIAAQPQNAMQTSGLEKPQDNVRKKLQENLATSRPYFFPHNTTLENLSALQLASYFGYHRLVYVLLQYSVSEWKEIKEDCDRALKITEYVTKRRKGRESNPQNSEELERKKSDYGLVMDFLKDPPAGDYELVRGWSEIDDLNQIPQLDGPSQRVAEQFDATIVDFHQVQNTKRVDFLRRTRTVWDVIYAEQTKPDAPEKNPKPKARDKDARGNDLGKKQPKAVSFNRPLGEIPGGPKKIMEDARKKTQQAMGKNDKLYTEDNLKFRWLHLSANNLEWMMDLTKRVYRDDKKKQEVFRQLAEFIRQGLYEVPGKRPYMRPSCTKELPGTPPEVTQYTRLALYMPYVTFADYVNPRPEDHNDRLAEIYAPKKTQNSNSKIGSKSNVKNDWKILHRSRTLDQFYYHSLEDTQKRDEGQVVTRYIHHYEGNKSKTPPGAGGKKAILRVDQLWLWVIDEKTIITSSSNRLDDKDDPVLEGIFNYLKEAKGKRKGQAPPSSVDEMSKFITTFCIDQIDKDTWKLEEDELSARQMFANTINDKANQESLLFDGFKTRINKKLKMLQDGKKEKKSEKAQKDEQKEDYESIDAATNLLHEFKDIRDELNILNYLLTQQQYVWEKLLGLTVNEYGTISWNDPSRKEAEKWKGPGFALKDIIEMDKVAQSIQNSVSSVLGLEQNEANISEAESSREQAVEATKQGRTLMVFTIITIVFLPMSFLTSLFALNVTVFPHQDNTLVYKPKFIFPIIFSITAVIALPIIDFASKKWGTRILREIYSKWTKGKQPSPKQSTTPPTHKFVRTTSPGVGSEEVSPSASQKVDKQPFASEQPYKHKSITASPPPVSQAMQLQRGANRLLGRFLGFFKHPSGNHLDDEEKGLKRMLAVRFHTEHRENTAMTSRDRV